MIDILTIAAGAVEGYSTINTGLEQAAALLGTFLSSNSAKMIEHTLGPSAGVVATETFDAVGNLINIRGNINSITLCDMAQNTGIGLVQDFIPKPRGFTFFFRIYSFF